MQEDRKQTRKAYLERHRARVQARIKAYHVEPLRQLARSRGTSLTKEVNRAIERMLRNAKVK